MISTKLQCIPAAAARRVAVINADEEKEPVMLGTDRAFPGRRAQIVIARNSHAHFIGLMAHGSDQGDPTSTASHSRKKARHMYHNQHIHQDSLIAAPPQLSSEAPQTVRDLDGYSLRSDDTQYHATSKGVEVARSRTGSKRRLSDSTISEQTPSFRQHGRREMTAVPSLMADENLGSISSRVSMTNGLLQIYHDSMENALSCWLTEHNCPYTMSVRSQISPAVGSRAVAREWGSSWSNRMFDRVIRLDRAYASLRRRPLTADEERKVSKALNMSIMAFASQWAQAGDRGSHYSSYPAKIGFAVNEFPQSNEFERSMQESLWHQTSQLLHQAAYIDSFRVVFALIIFSLAQKPLDTTQPTLRTNQGRIKYEDFQAMVQDEEAPLFLEIALRQVLSHRRKLERFARDTADYKDSTSKDPLDREDRATFDLLYWLGVMFDTLSAAMFQRAVVVGDDDCELPHFDSDSCRGHALHELDISPKARSSDYQSPSHDSATSSHIPVVHTTKGSELWGELFIRNGRSRPDHELTRWPCSYELAASTLSHAAPVKVLLFRRVSHLQALVSQKASASRIESAITSAMDVYNHWNHIYDPFMGDCVKYHDELPTRVQSWYTLIAGHWYLGTFLLSDLVLEIDSTHLSLPSQRSSRQASNFVSSLRRRNALSVADLSRSSVGSSSSKAQDFHFALNQAALLTEPWTVVFVRSLCRAGYILAEIALSNASLQETGHVRRRCGDCIEGLWSLGRKSDMAFLAARFLSDVLGQEKKVDVVSLVFDDTPSRIEHIGQDDTIGQDETEMHDITAIGASLVGDLAGPGLGTDMVDPFQLWPPFDEVGGDTLGPLLSETEAFGMDMNMGYDLSPFEDVALQQQLWGY
ncbi:hypothetical protein NX059_011105 [Plenodomus lindquistii]|nr:hypothetical protein NX059_011105 [Plenodomus lindquistii]